MEPAIVVHGGAAFIAADRIEAKLSGVQEAAKEGHEVLLSGGSAVDAVEAAIVWMENNEYFNAGFGSVLTLEGIVQMDSSIMDGSDLTAGSCAIVEDVLHPISLARLVKDKSPHVLIAGPGASKFARDNGMETVPPEQLVSDYARTCLETFLSCGMNEDTKQMGGTVGCVAIDKSGNVAAGTSTGGTNGKLLGRIGDTPIIGCGTYADNTYGAVSSTGHGEAIIRMVLAHSVVKELEAGKTPTEATETCVKYLMEKTGNQAGAICVSKTGEIGLHFTSKMMPWASFKSGQLQFGVFPGKCDCKSKLK